MSKRNTAVGSLVKDVAKPSTRDLQSRKRRVVDTPVQTAHELLRIVRAAQPIPRVAVARRLGVHRRRITVLVKPLLDSGVLREGVPDRTFLRGAGRPPIGLSLRSEREFLIGVNLGVSQIRLGAVTVDGTPLFEETCDTPSDPKDAVAEIKKFVDRQTRTFPDRELVVVAIGVPGPVDAERRQLLYAPRLGWRKVDIAEMLDTHVPVIVENNATAAAVYEAQRRRGRGTVEDDADFVLVRAGTGIGVGLVLAGEVFRGTEEADIAGEFGHMTIVAGGKSCSCGNFGCWERYASAASAVELFTGDSQRARFRSTLRFSDLVARAHAGDRRAQVTLERVGTHLGIGIGNVICGLGVPNVVVSGELVQGWKFIETSARAAIAMSLCGRLSRWSLEAGDVHGSELGGPYEVAIEHHLLSVVDTTREAA